MKSSILFLFSIVFVILAFKKADNESRPTKTGTLKISFNNKVGEAELDLNKSTYTNASGESFTISLFNYFVSNFVLIKEDGSEYIVPRDSSYFLIKESNPSQDIELKNIPIGAYVGIRFVLGVDSLKSASPVEERIGCLDPAAEASGMYWSWNSGYIFMKMEGSSSVATSSDKKFRYHIGGFGGYKSPMFNNIKRIELPFNQKKNLVIKKGRHSTLMIKTDALKVMNGSMNLSIAAKSTVMVNPFSINIANNYANMFSIEGFSHQ